MPSLRKIRWQYWLLILGFCLSLAITAIFAFRFLHLLPRRSTQEPIRPWMSVPYIAHAYHLPPATLFQALGLPDNRHDRRPIAVIARDQQRPVQEVIAIIRNAIIQARPGYPPPPTSFPDPTRGVP